MLDDDSCPDIPRVIRKDKYETQDLATYNWWLKLFDIMENEVKIPHHQRKDVLREIFPDAIFNKILSLMTVRSVKEEPSLHDSTSIKSKKSVSFNEEVEEEVEQEEEEQKSERQEGESIVTRVPSGSHWKRLSSQLRVSESRKEKNLGRTNPYKKFFNTNIERVAIWRGLPPLKLEEMNLNQKAIYITESIAVGFVNWLLKLGGETETTLDVQQIVKMFEIGFNIHAATSLEGLVRELPSVTKSVAVAKEVPEKWSRMKLKQELRKDIEELKKGKLVLAFDTMLPPMMRYLPPTVDHTKRWLEIRAPKQLTTMSAVWDGITSLRSTRAYCQWLIQNPTAAAPKYLVDLGMVTPEFFLQRHYSVESLDSGNDDVEIDVDVVFNAHTSAMYN